MKRIAAGSVVAMVLVIVAGDALAQMNLPIKVQGTKRYYASYSFSYYGTSTSTTTLTTSNSGTGSSVGLRAGYWLTYNSSYPLYTARFTSYQAVVILSLFTAGPTMLPARSAYLTFYVYGNRAGTWTLWPHLIDSGNITSGMFYNTTNAANFGASGATFTTTATSSGTIRFNIAPFVNQDIALLHGASGYTLVYNGSPTDLHLSNTSYTGIPEPGTLALFGLGLVTFVAGYRIRRRKKAA